MNSVTILIRRFSGFMLSGLVAAGCLHLAACNLLGAAAGVGMMKLQFGCLVEGTRIDTARGTVAVEDLKAGDRVIGYSGSEVVILQIHEYREDPSAQNHLTVNFSSGTEIRLSPRHRIGGIPAGRLAPGERIGDAEVTSVRQHGGVQRSYDLLTGDSGYRIGGIPVNSMIGEMQGRPFRQPAAPKPAVAPPAKA